MTADELIDLGKLLRAMQELTEEFDNMKRANQHLATQVMSLTQQVRRLPCMNDPDNEPDTDPDCPAILSSMPPHRKTLHSIGDDEPDSVVTRPISVHAGPFGARGPGVMVGAILVLMTVSAGVILALSPYLVSLVH